MERKATELCLMTKSIKTNLGTFLLFSCSEKPRYLKPKIMPNLMAYAQQISSLWGSWIQGTSKNPLTEMVQQKAECFGLGYSTKKNNILI